MNVQAEISTTHEDLMANAIRVLAMDAVQAANSGHPGAPMGLADVATVVYNRFMRVDPTADKWADRDRFVMSAGHGSMLVYAINHMLGYDDMDMDQIRNFRQWGYRTAGHPEYGHAKGIEVTTGPLGQGITNAVGMALAERMANARYGDDVVDHYTYVLAGDGCLMEGISHEAIDFAGHHGLGRLVVMWDDNRITIDGSTDVSTSMNQQMRFEAAGWHVQSVDGHDKDAIAAAIEAARNVTDKPSMIACRTIIGFGAPNKQGSHSVHGAPLGDEEIAAARDVLGWSLPAFELPREVYDAWGAVAARGRAAREAWEARLKKADTRAAFEAAQGEPDLEALDAAMNAYKAQLSADAPKVATRKASEMALEVVNGTLPNTVGGSADLTGSNNTRTKAMADVTAADYSGDYVRYGVREFAMAAIMNGMALHGGFVPYGGTFLVFADYMRNAIRMSALMGLPVTYVLTHDSIGLGEDGPTHQPVETIASLRAIPNLDVYRPADVVETAEAWQAALANRGRPTVLALSRQGLPCLRTEHSDANKTARGAYVLRDTDGGRDVTLIATGSEVEIAVQAAEQLAADGIRAAVVSAPSFEAFARQDETYRNVVLGDAPRVGVEAAVKQSWGEILGCNAAFVGMTGFGASAPAGTLYEEFGITADAVAKAARDLI